MIVYGNPRTSATIGEAARALEGLRGDDRLVAEGMLEQGIADLPEGVTPTEEQTIEIKTPEGFAFYGLHPEQYRRAARRWLRECGASGEIVVIGIRSIGTTLSRTVAEEVGGRRCTVRPKGDPFARTVELPDWIEARAAAYLVVDEGPGMSGSSFVAVSNALERRGVERRRIHFFPGHDGEPGAKASEEIRAVWREIRRWVEPAEWTGLNDALDWKYIGPTLPWPFDCSGEAERCARRSEELSCGVPVVERSGWWLGFRKIDGGPARVDADRLAKHIRAVADVPLRRDDEMETEARLRAMLCANVEKYFRNADLDAALRRWLDGTQLTPGGASSGDGHLEPENWVRDGAGRVWKLDTTGSKLSHMVAYRLSWLWDVAQAMLEWDLERPIVDCDPHELSFFKMAYAALGLGKSVMFQRADKAKWERTLVRVLREQIVW